LPPVVVPSKHVSIMHRLGVGVIGGLVFIAAVGGAFAMGLNTKMEYEHLTSASSPRSAIDDDDDEEGEVNDDDNNYANRGDGHIMSLSLDTLSGGGRSAIDIHECLENAMRSRHVRFRETLCIIDSSEITLTGIIGEGSYGRVWAARWRNNTVAVKEFVFAQAALMGGSLQTVELIEEIVGEAGIMSLLNHPKILQLYGVSLTTQTIWIVAELCAHGSLRSLLSTKSINLDLKAKLSLCMDIADGMRYLHTRRPPIIHRDLKSQNIFIIEAGSGRFVAKIGDWGSARAIELSSGGFQHMTQGIGTTCWLAPEVIEHAHASLSSDVYAYGIIVWEICTRNEVYEGLTAAQIIARVVKTGLRPVAPEGCPVSDLMQRCWSQDPGDRPSFKEILKILTQLYESAS
jgi:serine/threonine protein kinase